MADEAAPSEFDAQLAELAAELAKASPVERRDIVDRARVRPGQLPYMPKLPARAIAGPTDNPADVIVGALDLPAAVRNPLDTAYQIGEAGPRQVQRAEGAIRNALDDPSVGSIANAGTQTGMALMRPAIALPSLGIQYADAAAKDLGLFDTSANAQGLTRAQRREMEMERQRAERQAEIDRKAAETSSKLKTQEADAEAARKLKTDAEAKNRAEYDRQVAESETAFNTEMGRNRRFSDTNVGKVYDATGGIAPAIMGFAGAKLSRLATGPGKTTAEVIGKDYALPLATGTVTGMITPNAPLFYDALQTPVDNPKKRAYEARGEALPPNHPRRQEYLDYAASLPEKNPIRKEASEEYYDPEKIKERLLMGGVEGFGGGLLGTDAVRALARGAKGIAERLRGPAGAQPIGVATAGTAADIPFEVNALSRAPTAGPVTYPPTLPASGGRNALAGPETSQRQLPAPEASANRSSEVRVLTKSKAGLHDEKGRFTSDPRKKPVDE